MGTFRFIGQAALTARAQAALEAAVTESAHDLVEKARGQSPVDSGALRAGIHVTGGQAGGGAGSAKAYVTTGTPEYARYVEEGTKKMAGRPFMLHALLEEAPAFAAAVRRAVKAAF